ncbi:hypothetical protein [Anaeromicrobium sediminis]|uniref:Uncharacterized protein n=1 Tax=Anaeromicrobium sediminis TaxID=1478221 RepID=A0A267MP46_9FIRM|nr:hypothetical protein [Anaeromicrobium sediminis]PAB60593.1 hypothetical protein CCE28_03355 [Anaeromicrobium sediminis]
MKEVICIFNIFKRATEPETENVPVKRESQLDRELKTLRKIEKHIPKVKENKVFSNLVLFVSYYMNIIDFHKGNGESIVSVDELLLLKYIDMINKVLESYDENNWSEDEINEFVETLNTINDKLYKVIKRTKEENSSNLKIDLKTINDLVKSDFN